MLRPHFVVSLLVVSLIFPSVVSSQGYPNKPIRILTAQAGGGSDFMSRIIAQELSGPLGQPMVVDNRGNTIVAADAASKSPPDGYALFVGGSSIWIFPLLQKAPYDPVRDLTPISLIERTVNFVAVHPSLPVTSVKELIALAKAKPGELNYALISVGGTSHLGAELFKSMAGINIVGVPYKGTAPAITALISGEVQMSIVDAFVVVPHMKSGKLRILAVTSPQSSALAPGLPTMATSGLPGYEMTGMTGFFASGKTPASIVNRLNQEVVRVLNREDVKQKFLNTGSEVVGNSPDQFAAIVQVDIVKLGKLIKDAGLRAD